MRGSDAARLPANAVELVSREEMAAGFDRLAAELQPLVDAGDVVLLAVMTGGFFPLMRLAERLTGDYLIDYCHATRYHGARQGQADLEWIRRPGNSVAGRCVLVVDDIYDEGRTLASVVAACREAGAAQVHTVVEVVKATARRAGGDEPDFSTGISVPDSYVIGCGMDLGGRWRHLQAIYALPDEAT